MRGSNKIFLSSTLLVFLSFLGCGGGDKRTLVTPILSVKPVGITLDLAIGSEDPAAVKLYVKNDAEGLLAWNISGNREWLRFENPLYPGNSSATVSGIGPAEIIVETDFTLVSSQNPESVSAAITVSAADPNGITASGSPLTIPVILNIWDILTSGDGLPGSEINNIFVNGQDDVWVGTNQGAARITADGIESYTQSNSGLVNNQVNAINVSPDDSVWFGTGIGWNDAEGGLSRYYPGDDSWVTYTYQSTNGQLALNSVSAIVSTPSGEIWFGTPGGGLSHYDGTGWEKFTTRNTPDLVGDFILALTLDPDERVWLGSNWGPGLFDGINWASYAETITGPVNAVAVDSQGSTWVGTGNGFWILSAGEWQEFHLGEPGSPSDLILSLAPEPGGKVWIGTASGLVRYENGTGENVLFNHQPWNRQINSIGIEPDGGDGYRKWLATPEGIYVYPGD